MQKITAQGLTDVGQQRDHNEDAFVCEENIGFYVVCDGMGGHASGELASRVAVDEVVRLVRDRVHAAGSGEVSEALIRDAIRHANERVFVEGMKDAKTEGMGTTMVALFPRPEEMVLAHVGDSRIYRLNQRGRLDLLTRDHSLLNEKIDGTFPVHHPDPTVPKNLEQVIATVRDEGCEAGVAFDGDGDRIGVVDGNGDILWGDQILALLARPVLAEQPGATIIADVKASQVLFDEVVRLGGEPLMWKTGHSLIKSKMAETGAPLAGEMSGHIFFADRYYGYDDALYAALRLLGLVSGSGESLAALRSSLPVRVNTPELRFECADERKFDAIEEVRGRLAAAGAAVDASDGVRVSTADGWWLLRASNTQPMLVARCEAKDQTGLTRLKEALVAQLSESGIAPPEF